MSTPRPAAVLVLAAGEGTRMRSTTPKVLHQIGGSHSSAMPSEPPARQARSTSVSSSGTIVTASPSSAPRSTTASSSPTRTRSRGPLGQSSGPGALPADLSGTVLVTYGDVPLLTGDTLLELTAAHLETGSAVSVVTARSADPTGYGRVVRDENGGVEQIVEHKDATEAQRAITEINSGIYAFDASVLREALAAVGTDNAQGEKYLTDVVALARAAGRPVRAHVLDDLWQTEGVNDRVQLAALGRAEPPVCEGPHARRRDDRRPGDDVDRRRRDHRPGHHRAAGHPAAGGYLVGADASSARR